MPSVYDFIHKIYIHVARKIYTNIYLFEKNIAPLQTQKNSREVEIIIKECILNAIRDSIPVEGILRAYMDETEEQDVEVKEVTEPLPDAPIPDAPIPDAPIPAVAAAAAAPAPTSSESTAITKENIAEYKQTTDYTRLSFADDDSVMDEKGNTSFVNSPKDEKNLEELEKNRVSLQSSNDDDDDEEADERITIGENVKLDIIDINDLNKAATVELAPPVLDFEVLT